MKETELERILNHKGPMSKGMLRTRRIEDARRKLEKMQDTREAIREEQHNLCETMAREQYNKMDMAMIRARWDASSEKQRRDMTEFIACFRQEDDDYFDESLEQEGESIYALEWDEIDTINMSGAFEDYAGL